MVLRSTRSKAALMNAYHEFSKVRRKPRFIINDKPYSLWWIFVQIPDFSGKSRQSSRRQVLGTAQIGRAAVLSVNGTG